MSSSGATPGYASIKEKISFEDKLSIIRSQPSIVKIIQLLIAKKKDFFFFFLASRLITVFRLAPRLESPTLLGACV